MFIQLRNHTTYSLCKGAIKISDLVESAKHYNMPALGITDCANLFGALEFSLACKKKSIQPILGCEMLINFQDKDLKNFSNLDIERSLAQMSLIAASEEGYKNLMHLVSHSFLNRANGLSPHVNFDLLKEKAAGLIALSGGVSGVVGKMLIDDQEKKITAIISELQKTFSQQNFYMEISRHGIDEEKKLEEKKPAKKK
jgi:DNA polymerase-3 subunit alpha